jgi:hypothetical protein
MIPETTREALLEAMQRFDTDLRDVPDWSSWPQEAASHRWAIVHDGRQYPVKQIISMATGQPTSGFSGGEQANGFAARYGFEITRLGSEKSGNDELLDRYLAEFGNLHSLTGEDWPDATLHRAPHKPLLLMSVLDLIDRQLIRSNHIELNDELRQRFMQYWVLVMTTESRPDPRTPFRHMASEDFWHLTNPPESRPARLDDGEVEETGARPPMSATLDADLFELLQTVTARKALADVLLRTYFSADAREALATMANGRPRSYWWVNQGSTYKQERAGSYLWAPRAGKSNVAFAHRTNVSKLQPGDVILHYANNNILAVAVWLGRRFRHHGPVSCLLILGNGTGTLPMSHPTRSSIIP